MPPPAPPPRSPAPPYPRASEVPVDAPPRDAPERGGDWDAVDEASWESFPASDPPSFTPQHAVTEPPGEAAAPARRPRAERRARLLGLAGIPIAFAAGFAVGYRVRRPRSRG